MNFIVLTCAVLSIFTQTCMAVAVSNDAVSNQDPEFQLTASHDNINGGFTRDLLVNCSFVQGSDSEIGALISLILSKTSTTAGDSFTEIAAITQLDHNTVEVKDDLGATVTGELSSSVGMSYIVYKWQHPNSAAAGNYECTANGMDKLGHPVSSVAHTTVTESGSVDLQTVIEAVKTLELNQDSLKAQLKNTTDQLNAVTTRINQSIAAIFSDSSSFRGHDYMISFPMAQNAQMFQAMCNLYGGYLVEFQDDQEVAHVVTLEKSAHPGYDVMVGYSDEGHEGSWVYMSTGSVATFAPWASGQPHSGRSSNYAVLDDGDMKLYSRSGYTTAFIRFICEIPQ